MIGDLPFVKRIYKKSKKGTFSHTVYVFPWISNPEAYIHQNNKAMINELIEKYEKLTIEEMLEEENKNDNDDENGFSNGNRGTNNNTKKNRQKFLLYLSKKIEKLSTYTQVKKEDLLKLLIRIGEVMNNGSIIWSMDRYLEKCLREFGYEVKGTEKIREIYKILIGENDLYTLELDGYISDLLAI